MRTLYIIDCGVPEKGAIHYSSTSFLLVSNFLLWNIMHCYRNLYYKGWRNGSEGARDWDLKPAASQLQVTILETRRSQGFWHRQPACADAS